MPTEKLYAARTLTQKLGIVAGEQVAVVGAPPGFAALLDFKVCRIDATWSGLAFKQRRRQT